MIHRKFCTLQLIDCAMHFYGFSIPPMARVNLNNSASIMRRPNRHERC